MSVNQILDELSQLDVKARRAIFRRLVEIDPTLEENESPELLEAIDAGITAPDGLSGRLASAEQKSSPKGATIDSLT